MVYMDIFLFAPLPSLPLFQQQFCLAEGGGLFEGEDVAKHFGQGAEFFERVGANPR